MAVFLAVDDPDFFAVDEEDFFAGAFFAVDFEAVDFEALEAFFAGDFFAAEDELEAFLAVDEPEEDFFAGAFFAVDLAAPEDFFAAVEDFFVVDEAADRADEAPAPAAFFAAPGAAMAVASVSFGSFLAPEMTFFRSAPGVNLGTDFFFVRSFSPVCGFRTVRAFRTRFSNDPNPVMATFSPLATSRVMVSSTASSACAAAFRFPSNRAASVSMS